jgi:hypothetical protein
MGLYKTGIVKNIWVRKLSLIGLMLALLIVSAGCATQHKYKKIKSVPCPCEKLQRR